MRILSWNVNGLRAVEKKGFLPWLQKEEPDLLCVQETKAAEDQLSEALISPPGYHSYWASAQRRGYSGVAIYSREPVAETRLLGAAEFDDEGRVLQAELPEFTLINAYFPNSQEAGARLSYKLGFCRAIREHCDRLRRRGRHFVLCGDYNIAHTAIDLARPGENEGSAGYLPEERAWMDAFTGAGYVDTFRRFHPGETGQYTWWSYRSAARARNVGWRLDYFCVDPEFLPQVRGSAIMPEVTGSDHCPVALEITLSREARQ